jgi:NAD(P)-dependent dehydrogenase (short-subunit alcohol dehydrogenase family)
VDALGLELTALVNNAGLGRFGPLAEASAADFRAVVATNLTGAFLCCREALKRMRSAGGGRIVNIGSIAESAAFADCAAYAASKAGLRALSDAMRVEGRPHGVLVTHVILGAVATAIWSDRPGFDVNRMLTPSEAGERIASFVLAPDGAAIEEVRLMPPAGTLEPES